MLEKNTNQHFSHTLSTTASTEKIWKIWTNVAAWKDWDLGLQKAKMSGDFVIGAEGVITSLDGRETSFYVTAIDSRHAYTIKIPLLLSSLYIRRSLRQEAAKTYFTHEVYFKGFSAVLFAWILGKQFKKLLAPTMEQIKQIAEQK